MAEFQNRWVTHLRNNARHEPSERNLRCLLCSEDILPDIDAFRAHVRADEYKHLTLTGDADIVEAFKKMAIHAPKQRSGSTSPKPAVPSSAKSLQKRPSSRHLDGMDGTASRTANQQKKSAQPDTSTSAPRPKKARSPPSSMAPASSPPTTPGRSHRRSGVASDFDRGDSKNSAGRQLWNPADEHKSRSARPRHSAPRRSRPNNRPPATDLLAVAKVHPADMTTDPSFELLLQHETKPISREKLVNEVKGIYEGLTLVEKKCIELTTDPETRIPEDQELSVEQYQNLIGLHHTLLNEHHDFFLASQHPSANDAISHLPAKYRMSARMWRHGIQSFLELLRKRLPGSREHMLTFITIAYNTMTLQYETIRAFSETWIECLGDLARYRMAIEDDDIRDRENWASVSRNWYSKASDRSPEVGRLYHHLAILARPDALQQLYYYTKSLCVPVPFPSAWDSIMTLFKPILEKSVRLDPSDELFVRVHAILFSGCNCDELDETVAEFLGTLDKSIAKRSKDWLHSGCYIAISLICSLVGYGAPSNPLQQLLPQAAPGIAAGGLAGKNVTDKDTTREKFETTRSFAMQTCNIVLRRKSDINCLPFFHTMLVFLYYVAQHPKAISLIEDEFPWKRVADVLNEAYPALMSPPRMAKESFPRPPPNEPLRPLPEDYSMRGLGMSKDYFAGDWFSSEQVEDEEKMFEPPSLGDERRQRLLWLGRRICGLGNWLEWDESSSRFTVSSAYDRDISLPVET